MADPLSKTFALLASTKRLVAVDVLVAALDTSSPAIREKAVGALLRRGTTRCQTELIRRLSNLSAAARKQLESQGARLSVTLRQCVLHGDAALGANGLSLIESTHAWDQIPTLLQILQRREHPLQEQAGATLRDLITCLDHHCHPDGSSKLGDRQLRNIPQIRHEVLTVLDAGCDELDHFAHRKDVIEYILILGDPDNFAVRKVLLGGSSACREVAASLLITSRHPGVMRLLVEFLGAHYPHGRGIDAIEKRTDVEFAIYALRSLPKSLSDAQQKNLKQITRVGWAANGAQFSAIPRELHEALVAFLQATSLPLQQKIDAQKWILRHGSVEGRLAAGHVLDETAPDMVRGILSESLDSNDEEVQAWATTQLRTQGVPEAIHMLVERLDSPLPAVREAARDELGSFNLELMLTMFDHLDPGVCLRAGALIRKIDPNCIQRLSAELGHAVQRRRIQAVRAAQALGLAMDVQQNLLDLLADGDTQVRRTAAEVLGGVPTPDVVAGLAELLNDSSPRVRDAAEHALEKLQRVGVEFSGLAIPSDLDRKKAGE